MSGPHDNLNYDCRDQHDHHHFVSVIIAFIIFDIDVVIFISTSINHHALYED